jgi:hypothetical protein
MKYDAIKTLQTLGIDYDDAKALRRISMTLRRWYELECGTDAGHIERNEKTGKPMFYNARSRYLQANDPRAWSIIPDREKGALKRLGNIMAKYPDLKPYLQTDPRGAALYILRPNDVPEGKDASAYYTRGIVVY